MDTKEKRKTIRVRLLDGKCHWKLADGYEYFDAKVSDFNSEGCFVQSLKPVGIKEHINLVFPLPGDLGEITIYGQVKWNRWHLKAKDKSKYDLGFGVEFTAVSESQKKILDSYTTYLRNRQIIAVSKRIIEEFFSKVPPTVK
jgi:Tfp pilus assembly protein PilZ